MAKGGSASIEVADLTKRYGAATIVDGLSVSVAPGEFLTLLGPSGCGKTTTLRCIGGFVRPDAGTVRIDSVDMSGVPPYRRHLGMVFQNYALFPHLSVYENVAFGLRIRGVGRAETAERVRRTLEMVRLGGLEERAPRQLSGGQQQRVALARALVYAPRVLLLDEPLSNLDARLRVEMRTEIRALQRELGVTALYVTHDQEEALSISDRVMIMNAGRIEQLASPWEVYNRPQTTFVASFVGTSNILPAVAVRRGDEILLRVADAFDVPCPAAQAAQGQCLWIVARPESITLADEPGAAGTAPGRIRSLTMLGAALRVEIGLANSTRLIADLTHHGVPPRLAPGDAVTVRFEPERIVTIPRAGA